MFNVTALTSDQISSWSNEKCKKMKPGSFAFTDLVTPTPLPPLLPVSMAAGMHKIVEKFACNVQSKFLLRKMDKRHASWTNTTHYIDAHVTHMDQQNMELTDLSIVWNFTSVALHFVPCLTSVSKLKRCANCKASSKRFLYRIRCKRVSGFVSVRHLSRTVDTLSESLYRKASSSYTCTQKTKTKTCKQENP